MEPLRPMNLGEVLDRTFHIYRSRFLVFVGIASIPATVMFGIQLVVPSLLRMHSSAHPPTGSILLWNYAYWLGLNQIFGFMILLISPALVHVTSTACRDARGSFWAAIRFATAHSRGYLWIAVLKLAAEVVIPELLFAAALLGEILIAFISWWLEKSPPHRGRRGPCGSFPNYRRGRHDPLDRPPPIVGHSCCDSRGNAWIQGPATQLDLDLG